MGEPRIYQKEIKNTKDFYRELALQVQETKAAFMPYYDLYYVSNSKTRKRKCVKKIINILRLKQGYQEALMYTCLQYLSCEKCKDKVSLQHVLKIYLQHVFALNLVGLQIEHCNHFYTDIEKILNSFEN